MTIEEMTLLARCNGLHTQTFRMEDGLDKQKYEVIEQDLLKHVHSDHTNEEEKCSIHDHRNGH